jgi:hypothetical protein
LVLLLSSARSKGYPRAHKEIALSTDWYTKLVLTVLAACAVILTAQELRGTGGAGSREEQGRFLLQVLPMGRMMLKIDSETGKIWRANFPDPKAWQPIADEPIEAPDETTPQPGEEKAGAPEAAAPQAPEVPAASDPMAAGTP